MRDLLFRLRPTTTSLHELIAHRLFQILIGGAVVLRCFSLRWQWISPARARRHGAGPALPLPEQLQVMLRSRSLLVFIAFGAVWSFAANCFGPFYHVFMFDQLRLGSNDVVLMSQQTENQLESMPAYQADQYADYQK